MEKTGRHSVLFLFLAMFIFGTIGIFRKHIPLSSSVIAMARGFIGTGFLLILIKFKGDKLSLENIKKEAGILCASGAMIGINWILLFEAYEYTSVATATLCYYMAPIIVILASPFLFKEKLTKIKGICSAGAFIGMIFVSGILSSGFGGISEMKGILLGLGAAVLYAGVVLLNKKLTKVGVYERTVMQLGVAGIVILPYNLLAGEFTGAGGEAAVSIILLLILVGVLHTGIAYALYFGSLKKLKAQTAALFSYVDPVVAIILSAAFLNESMGLSGVIGTILILGSAFVSEFSEK